VRQRFRTSNMPENVGEFGLQEDELRHALGPIDNSRIQLVAQIGYKSR
jgi:hypothetical protein